MASKVLVPAAPFAKLQFLDFPVHRLLQFGFTDLQFQLIFNKESPPKICAQVNVTNSPENINETEDDLKREVTRLEKEVASVRDEARASEARALHLQKLVDEQAERLREIELKEYVCSREDATQTNGDGESSCTEETRAELRARLADAERLVRRLRADADRQRREVSRAGSAGAGAGVTNLLFDGALASHAHLQCMKNSLHASLRVSGFDGGFGYQNNYHFPPVHAQDFWREPIRDEYAMMGSRGRSTRRPLTLPEISGQQIHRSTVYANNHTRSRANVYDQKSRKGQVVTNGDTGGGIKATEGPPVNTSQSSEGTTRARPSRRHQHRKLATDNT